MLLNPSCTAFLLIAETDALDAKPWIFHVRTWLCQCPLLNAVAYVCGSLTYTEMDLIARWLQVLQQDHKLTIEDTLLFLLIMEFYCWDDCCNSIFFLIMKSNLWLLGWLPGMKSLCQRGSSWPTSHQGSKTCSDRLVKRTLQPSELWIWLLVNM